MPLWKGSIKGYTGTKRFVRNYLKTGTEMTQLRTCPECGYRNGFHVSVKRGVEGPEMDLVCPSCGQDFDLFVLLPPRKNAGRKGEGER